MLFDALIDKITSKIQLWDHRLLSFGGRITLIQSVLSTLPFYNLQVLKMPIQVRDRIFKLFNKFLWSKSPWCSWHKMCKPYEEGGLNFRALDDIFTASMIKAWYRLREGKRTWSKFMLAKYCKLRHPSIAKVLNPHSRLWKNLTGVRDIAEQHITWGIGKGDCDFFLDSWLPSGPINENAKRGICISEFWRNGDWDNQKLLLNVSSSQLQEITSLKIHLDSEDCILWKLSNNSDFTFKSAWELIRRHQELSSLYGLIWHSSIPKKSVFYGLENAT
ncbi:hypothetical protein LIER_20179 [Lithospermum erythrorhizon]|uniref:Uncharacterized protein n=1 Tax=Lithospermum erythrorhizon TaxID=34254 RepID=A0AAV3QPR2_LITER